MFEGRHRPPSEDLEGFERRYRWRSRNASTFGSRASDQSTREVTQGEERFGIRRRRMASRSFVTPSCSTCTSSSHDSHEALVRVPFRVPGSTSYHLGSDGKRRGSRERSKVVRKDWIPRFVRSCKRSEGEIRLRIPFLSYTSSLGFERGRNEAGLRIVPRQEEVVFLLRRPGSLHRDATRSSRKRRSLSSEEFFEGFSDRIGTKHILRFVPFVVRIPNHPSERDTSTHVERRARNASRRIRQRDLPRRHTKGDLVSFFLLSPRVRSRMQSSARSTKPERLSLSLSCSPIPSIGISCRRRHRSIRMDLDGKSRLEYRWKSRKDTTKRQWYLVGIGFDLFFFWAWEMFRSIHPRESQSAPVDVRMERYVL